MAVNVKYIDGLSNVDGLDDSFLFCDENYSNKTGDISPEMIQAGVSLTAGLISTAANRQRNTSKDEVKAACGRRPLLGKAKKAAYQKCIDNYLATKAAASLPPPTVFANTPSSRGSEEERSDRKKFLGMPIGVAVTVGVLAFAAIGFGVYKLVKK